MMSWYGHDVQWWEYAGMAIFWVLVILGIAAVVKYLVGDVRTRRGAPLESATAAEVLTTRFARGEIDETEYRDRMAVVRDTGQQ